MQRSRGQSSGLTPPYCNQGTSKRVHPSKIRSFRRILGKATRIYRLASSNAGPVRDIWALSIIPFALINVLCTLNSEISYRHHRQKQMEWVVFELLKPVGVVERSCLGVQSLNGYCVDSHYIGDVTNAF